MQAARRPTAEREPRDHRHFDLLAARYRYLRTLTPAVIAALRALRRLRTLDIRGTRVTRAATTLLMTFPSLEEVTAGDVRQGDRQYESALREIDGRFVNQRLRERRSTAR